MFPGSVDSSGCDETTRRVPPVFVEEFATDVTAVPKPASREDAVGEGVGVMAAPACATSHTATPATRAVAAAPAVISAARRRRAGCVGGPCWDGVTGPLTG